MSRDKIIVISTHILEEVDAVCNRAIIVAAGAIVADDTPEALVRRSRYHNAVTVRFEAPAAPKDVAAEVRALPGVDHVEVNDAERSLTAFPRPDAVIIAQVSDLAAAKRWPVRQLQLEQGRLDEVFRSITTREAA
jgi:ABC-2 type transport system ATP-binding protein